MAKLKLFQLFLLIWSSPILTHQVRIQAPPRNQLQNDHNSFRHVEVLDREGKYKLEWLVDWNTSRVIFNITVETRGWVGFGIGKDAKMAGADLIMGGVNWMGRPYFTDRYAVQNGPPLVDAQQDWKLHSARESQTHTMVSFSRKFDTSDKQDIPISDDTLIILWAYGETDDTREYHRGNRGHLPIYLRDPDLTPRVVQDWRSGNPEKALQGSDVKIWSVRTKLDIPAKRTTYWCNIRKITLPRKHHIIGFTFKINNQTQNNMHHMLIQRCLIPNPSSIYEQFVNHPGEECYNPTVQLGVIPFHTCSELIGGQAIGGRPIFLPKEMGIPIGTTGQSEYYMMQTHYDNPELRSDLHAEIEFDIYYTSKLRDNDGGFLSIGQHIPGQPSILLPPGTKDHRIYGHCSSSCTRKMFPPEGIKLVGGLLHAHNAARRLTLQHFRNDEELPPIFDDRNWKLNFQPIRVLRKEVTLLPGDHVNMRCFFDTTYTNKTTIGGYGADQEMCKIFALHYKLLDQYPICRSELISPNYTARYFAGTRNVTWDQSRIEYMATDPPHLRGMTLSQISDSAYVDWSPEQRAMLKRDHILHPQVELCPSRQEVAAAARGGPRPQPTFVSYPVHAKEYWPPQQCSASRG